MLVEINEIRNEMLEKGWVRIGEDNGGENQFIIEVFDPHHIPRFVDSFIAKNFEPGFGAIYVGSPDKDEAAIIHYPNPSIQKAVNRALRMQRRSALGLSKHAYASEYWFDPAGKQYEVKTNHKDWMVKNQKLLQDQYGINLGGTAPFIEMLKQGWVRVGSVNKGSEGDSFQFVMQVYDVNKIPDFMNDFVVQVWNPNLKTEYGTPGIAIENFDGSDDIVIDTPFPTLQKAVRKTMREWSKAASLGLSKRAYAIAFWVDPTGKTYRVEASHLGWMITNEELLERKYKYNDLHIRDRDDDAVNKLLLKGWTRVASWEQGSGYLEVADLHNAPRSLQYFLDENYDWESAKTIIIDDIAENYAEVDVTGDIQQDISKALHNKKRATLETTAFSAHAFWIDPAGKAYEVRGKEQGRNNTHAEWVLDNAQMLRRKYKINIPIDQSEGSFDTNSRLIEEGWTRIGDFGGSDIGIRVLNLETIPRAVENVLATFAKDGETIHIEDLNQNVFTTLTYPFKSLQREVNKSLMQNEQVRQQRILQKQKDEEENKQQNKLREEEKKKKLQKIWDELDEMDKHKNVPLPKQPNNQPQQMELPLSGHKVAFESPATTWDGTEPFTPLPTTFEWGTNDENLNSRYPWKFMRKPTGPDYSNEGEVDEILVDDEIEDRKNPSKEAMKKEALTEFGVWIDPSGLVYDVRNEDEGRTHIGWIEKHTDLLNTKYPDSLPHTGGGFYSAEKIFSSMIEAGWIRIGDSMTSNSGINIQLKDLRNIPSYVDNYLAEHYQDGMRVEIEAGTNLYKIGSTVVVDNPFPTLQKAVNRALADQHSMAASLKTSATPFRGWVDDRGKLFPLAPGETHGGWIRDNAKILKQHGIRIDENWVDNWVSGITDLINQHGWIRVDGGPFSHSTSSFSMMVSDLGNLHSNADIIPMFLQPGDTLFVETPEGEVVQLQAPVSNVQKEVRRALIQKNVHGSASLGLSKYAFSNIGFWVAPDGKSYQVRGGASDMSHADWIKKIQTF